jgi:hypothetical protein
LKETTIWAKSIYCQRVLQKLTGLRFAADARAVEDEVGEKIHSPFFRDLMEAAESENKAAGAKRLLQLLEGNRDIHLAFFDIEKEDEKTGLAGIYAPFTHPIPTPPALSLALRQLDDGKVNLFFEIGKFDKMAVREMGITMEEAVEIVEPYLWTIKEILSAFHDFVRYFETFSPAFYKSIAFSYAECLKHIKNGMENPQPIKISLEDSKYFLPKELAAWQGEGRINVICRFLFDRRVADRISSDCKWKGMWNGSLYLFKSQEAIPTAPAALKKELTDIEETVRHELQHLMQTYLSVIKATKDGYGDIENAPLAGLPGKKYRVPGYDEMGRPIKQEAGKERLEHDVQDVEFYTELTDNLGEYKRVIPRIPLGLRKFFFRCWVGQMPVEDFGRRMNVALLLRDKSNMNGWMLSYGDVQRALEKSQAFFGQFNALPKYQKALKLLSAELGKLSLL